MNSTRWLIYSIIVIVFCAALPGCTQTPTPAPTFVPFSPGCTSQVIDAEENLITNGDFQDSSITGGTPSTGWFPGKLSPVLGSEIVSADEINYFLLLEPGSSISTVPKTESGYSRFDLSFCTAVPPGGQIRVYVGGVLKAGIPVEPSVGKFDEFTQVVFMNLGAGASTSEKLIELTYEGIEPAYIDNVQLIPHIGGNDNNPTPTPTIAEPTPTPTQSGEAPTPTPTLFPGMVTPTPTPGVTADSIQIVANPPMLIVKPDDFAASSNNGGRKQIALDMQVVGSNGEKINVLDIDEDATIEFTLDSRGEAQGVGYIQGFQASSRNWNNMTNRRKDLADFYEDEGGRVYFFPSKPFEGTVKVIVEIEYDGWANQREEKRKIRGVVPIYLRVDRQASLTNATGSLNAVQNANLGRKPGDRGFRPDSRTNLYYRELMQ
jgi:hypothetical protein